MPLSSASSYSLEQQRAGLLQFNVPAWSPCVKCAAYSKCCARCSELSLFGRITVTLAVYAPRRPPVSLPDWPAGQLGTGPCAIEVPLTNGVRGAHTGAVEAISLPVCPPRGAPSVSTRQSSALRRGADIVLASNLPGIR